MFLRSTQLTGVKKETVPGVFEASLQTAALNVKHKDADWQNTPEYDNDQSEFDNGEIFSTDESVAVKFPNALNVSVRYCPPMYIAGTGAGDAQHINNYEDYFTSAGFAYAGIGTDVTDEAPGAYLLYPYKEEVANTVSTIRSLYDPGANKHQLEMGAGAVSNLVFSADGTGNPVTMQFAFSGKMRDDSTAVVDVSDASHPTFDGDGIHLTTPTQFRNATITLKRLSDASTHTVCVSSMSHDSGNQIDMIECQEGDSGFLHSYIRSIMPFLNINPLLRVVSDFDWWETIKNSSDHYQISITINGGEIQVFYPRVQIKPQSRDDDNGKMRNTLRVDPIQNIAQTQPVFSGGWVLPTLPDDITAIPYYILLAETAPDYQ